MNCGLIFFLIRVLIIMLHKLTYWFFLIYCGIEQLAARQSHKLKAAGSSPAPATSFACPDTFKRVSSPIKVRACKPCNDGCAPSWKIPSSWRYFVCRLFFEFSLSKCRFFRYGWYCVFLEVVLGDVIVCWTCGRGGV